ncbi:putative late blight resistance proteinR1A-10 [Sesamum alatum]|uniref:Late blight resistance proteinR1A-10 n=1 Tax=Sesamum alatum TaxID=300844 RepID=A0AAE1Z2W9_9LAMI|nr:putative late blight resistance proteinR1A-10 [Sesamum alatum]
MDDVWSNKAWDDFKQFFPNNGNGSRVVVTTRLSNVAVSVGSQDPYSMNLLDEENCWNLLCEKVFGQGGCPYPELEQIGKDIAKGCRGLPLAVVVIGGLLAKSNMTRVYWESVAENVNSFANSEDNEYCLKVLYLTYNNLPIHLKPCFLYMRVFPEDKMIKASKLIRLWVAEEFIKPARDKTLEEVAEAYLKDLIHMNLIFIRGHKPGGKIKFVGIHDLLRDLCLRESNRENFICISRVQRIYRIKEDKSKCYLCHNGGFSINERIDVTEIHVGLKSISPATVLVCKACKSMYPHLIRLRWVKVFGRPGGKLLQHTKLRYISFGRSSENISYEKATLSPFTLSLLWNLQSLYIKSNIVRPKKVLPSEIWMMPQLRHIHISWAALPDPMNAQDTTIVLDNLQTLSKIPDFKCTKEVVERIPNLKELKLDYSAKEEWSYYSLHNLAGLQKLESLSIGFALAEASESLTSLLGSITFPTSLKQLVLIGCAIPWEDMSIIGSLPNLEVLKLYWLAFFGDEWNPVEGEFLRLKALSLRACEPEWWRAEDIHFPSLEALTLEFSGVLKEIPSSIGDIATLKLIRLRYCNEHIEDSAKQILEEQRSNGNESLQLVICHRDRF